MKYWLIYILIGIFTQNICAQQQLLGKITAKSRELGGVAVINKRTFDSVESEQGGYFSIIAQPGDTLIFTAPHLAGTRRVVSEKDFGDKLVLVYMDIVDSVLEEIFIDRRINSETLGFGVYKPKTLEERALYTATTSGGGIIPVDAVVNAITGRTKMLKQAHDLQKEYKSVQDFLSNFSNDYLLNYLKLDKKEIQAFGFYAHTDREILKSLDNINQAQLNLLMVEKVNKFREYQQKNNKK